jgi:hypothetical protein
MNSNPEKRVKKFNKEMSIFKSHPNYDDIKELYVNNVIKTIVSAEKAIRKIRITNKGQVYKSSVNAQQKVVQQLDQFKTKKETKKLEQNFVKQRVIKLDDDKINNQGYGYLTNKIEFDRIRKQAPNCYYVQDVKYYNNNGQLINQGIFKNVVFDYVFTGTKNYKDFIKVVDMKMSVDGSDGNYRPRVLINEEDKEFNTGELSYTIITTTAYKKETKDLKVDLNQIYKDADTGHCVYDAFLNYFESKKDINRNAKAIYNKLCSPNGLLLKKSYTDDNINEIASFCNSTLKIRDIINGNDKDFKNDYARFYVELLNTKYNHLDLLQHTYNEIEEVENSEKLFDIKKNAKFYIEKSGLLITLDKTYKVKSDEFNDVFTEWKNENNFNELYIYENSDEYNMIYQYDNNLHTFFNNFEVDDKLYNEVDLKKAYFNYSDINYNEFYNGVPSGSFINIKCDDKFTIETFNELYNNKLIGYFEVKINKHLDKSDHFKVLGLSIGSNHVFTSAQINLLKKYIDFQFINASYAPSVHIPFNSKFLNKDANGLKHYCKAYGLMLKNSSVIDITIKPLQNDTKYYNTIDNEMYDIYKVDGLVKICYKNKQNKTFAHIAHYIHSYTRNLIINQILNMDINDVFGVKLDSIVVKKSAVFDFNESIFGIKKANIESMLKNICCSSGLDYGLDDVDVVQYSSSHYKPYFSSCDSDRIEFKESFLYSGDIIKNRIMFIGGAGGSGKTSSLLRNLRNENVCYTSSCWNLIQGQKIKYDGLLGFSIPNLTGSCAGYKTEKIRCNNIKYILIDELTLIDKKDVLKICDEYKNCFIFLLGDIEDNGFFYQCSLPTIKVIKPTDLNCQYIKYTKSYRFDNELKNKLDLLREQMKLNNNNNDKLKIITQYVKNNFSGCFYNKENINFNDSDIGISAINDYENNDNELTNYFIEKGVKPQYFIKTTNKNKGQLKGQQLDNKPDHSNYECKLFKTIHSFQGLDLNDDNKIIISITKNFDYNLFYTALSRARRLNQIVLLN